MLIIAQLLISLILGAIFRRMWGGWCSPAAWFKRLVGYLLPAMVTAWLLGFEHLYAVVAVAVLVGTGWWYDIPGVAWLHHAWGQRMGRGGPPPEWQCIGAMATRYGLITAIAGGLWEWLAPGSGGFYYIAAGWLAWVGYVVGYTVWEILCLPQPLYPPGENHFIDGPTAIGECFLGAIIIGGIPAAHLLQVLYG